MPEGECDALDDTDFGGRNCPFYKPSEIDSKTDLVFDGFRGRFRRIRGYGGKYLVSEFGQVINNQFQELTVYYSERGLPYLKLYKGNSRNNEYLAVLVADVWIRGVGKIDFKDHDPTNCAAGNIKRVL